MPKAKSNKKVEAEVEAVETPEEREARFADNLDRLEKGREAAIDAFSVKIPTLEMARGMVDLLASGVEANAAAPLIAEAKEIAKRYGSDKVDDIFYFVEIVLEDTEYEALIKKAAEESFRLFGTSDAETVLGVYGDLFADPIDEGFGE